MDLSVEFEKREGTLITRISGRIDAATSPTLQSNVEKESLEGIDLLVFVLSDISYFSSAGARVLVGLKKKMDASGRRFAICNASIPVNDVLLSMKLGKIFPNHTDLEKLIEEMNP